MKKTILLFGFLLLLLGPGFCQETSKHTEYMDLSYFQGEGEADANHKLNLVLPKEVKKAPLLIWIGGGAWSYVDRNMEMDLARKLADEGIAVASIGHRLSSAVWKDPSLSQGVKHPAHVEDVAMAIKWLYDKADEYGYSQREMIIGGFSSGAHLASLISLDPRYLKNWKLDTDLFKGVIPIGGTYDVPDYYRVFKESETQSHLAKEHVQAVFGENQEGFLEASPISYMKNLKTPMLLMSDTNTANYCRIFEDAIRESGFDKAEVHYAELGHGDLWRNMSYDDESSYRDLLIAFIKNHTKKNG
ncbi:MAG: alpha/beta hydrolase [Bacteroidia bacterium]|nr:alpha/beta hydrolase [Bacteroidia bacterium]